MDEQSNTDLTGQRIDQPSSQCEGTRLACDVVEEAKRPESPSGTHTPRDVNWHPIGAGVGALLAAGTGGATGGVLGGPVGAVVGVVIGAIAGSYGGKVIAELADPAIPAPVGLDEYTRRIHCPGSVSTDHETPDLATPDGTKQVPRETWSWLDQTPKELLTGDSPPPSDS